MHALNRNPRYWVAFSMSHIVQWIRISHPIGWIMGQNEPPRVTVLGESGGFLAYKKLRVTVGRYGRSGCIN